jgi:predicted permease
VRPLDGPARIDRDVAAEIEAHIEHMVDDLVDQGVHPEEARRQAEARFGDINRIAAECRAIQRKTMKKRRMGDMLDAVRQDLSFAVRRVLRNPAFAAVVVFTLAMGVAATTSVSSILRSVVLEPLPMADPDQIVIAENLTPQGEHFSVSEPMFLDWSERARVFQGFGALATRASVLQGTTESVNATKVYVNAGFFALLGIEPELGREFLQDEDRPGDRRAVAMLAHSLWVERYASDPGVVGTTVTLDQSTLEIVGVAPAEMDELLDGLDVFVPLNADPDMDRGEHYLTVVGRMNPGTTMTDASADLVAVTEELGRTYSEDAGWSAQLVSAEEFFIGSSTTQAAWVLLVGALMVLLMACVNISNLMLARATTQHGEMGIRAALGAHRRRLVRQVFTESLVLAAIGGAIGAAAAFVILPMVQALGAAQVPRLDKASIDGGILLVTLVSVAGAAVLFGMTPALRLREDSPAALLNSARGATRRRSFGRTLLVSAQVGLSVVLLVGTGLLMRSFMELTAVDPGFEPRGAMTAQLDLPDGTYDYTVRGPLMQEILDEIGAIPGVVHAGATPISPLKGNSLANFIAREDRMPDRAEEFTGIYWRAVTPGFFEAMDLDVRSGRSLTRADGTEGPIPVLIGESLARRLWADGDPIRDPIGETLVWGDPDGSRVTVIGVVEDLQDVALDIDPPYMLYRPHAQVPWAAMTVIVRYEGDAAGIAEQVRQAVRRVDPGLPVPELESLEENVRRAVAQPRFNMTLLGGFAFAGLILAVVGLYGITAFDVSQRFREIGIRISLGAEPGRIRSMILRDSLVVVAVGGAIGLFLAWASSRWLESLLFQVTPADPATWVAAVTTIALTAGAAAWIPARRATRVDPTTVLTAE